MRSDSSVAEDSGLLECHTSVHW